MSTDKQLVELIETGIGMLAEIRQYIMEHNVGAANPEKVNPENGVLTLVEVAERMRVSAQTLRKGYRRGRYPFFFREGVRLVTTRALYAKWLETHEKRAGFVSRQSSLS